MGNRRFCTSRLLHALVICIGPITYGEVIAYPSPAGKQIRQHHNLPDDDMSWAFYNSCSSLFAIFGTFFTSWLIKYIFKNSRRKTLFTISVLGIVFWLLNCLTTLSIWGGIFARCGLGIVIGAYTGISATYLVEIAPEGMTGFYGCFNEASIELGNLVVDLLGPFLDYMQLNYIGAALNLIQCICCIFFLMESPDITREQEIENNLIKELNDKENEKIEKADNAENVENGETEEKLNGDFGNKSIELKIEHQSLCDKKNIKNTAIGIFLMFLQQWVGPCAIVANLADIMNQSGLPIDGNFQAAFAVGVQLIAAVISAIVLVKFGRLPMWFISNVLVTIASLVFALNDKFKWSGVLSLAMVLVYFFGFSFGLGPIPWFLIPEYFDDAYVRAIASSLCSASNMFFSFITIFIFPQMKKHLGFFGSFLFFAIIGLIAVFFGFYAVRDPPKQDTEDIKDEIKELEDSETAIDLDEGNIEKNLL